MIMKKIFIIISMLLSANICLAAFNKDAIGTSSAQFLKLGVGGRAASMGNTAAASSGDSMAIYWNPAGINNTENVSLSVSHNVMLDSIYYEWVSVAKKFKSGTMGVGIQYLSYGSIVETDDTGLKTGNFKPNDMAVYLSYGKKFNNFLMGANVKFISSKIKESASAIAGDFGMILKLKRSAFGLALQNAGTKMKFDANQESLPMNLKLGAEFGIKKNWTVAFDVNAPSDDEPNAGAGVEYKYSLNDDVNFSGRAGYNTALKDTGGLNGLTAGFGAGYMGYNLDYAFVPFGDLGNTHRISLGISW